jgi:hypothetical protein
MQCRILEQNCITIILVQCSAEYLNITAAPSALFNAMQNI